MSILRTRIVAKILGLGHEIKMKISDYSEPQTIEEIIAILDHYFALLSTTNEEVIYFNNSTSDEITLQYHHGLGQRIRNAWLWKNTDNEKTCIYTEFLKLNILHPDDMSDFVLKLFWYYKHDQTKTLQDHKIRLLNEIIIKNIIE